MGYHGANHSAFRHMEQWNPFSKLHPGIFCASVNKSGLWVSTVRAEANLIEFALLWPHGKASALALYSPFGARQTADSCRRVFRPSQLTNTKARASGLGLQWFPPLRPLAESPTKLKFLGLIQSIPISANMLSIIASPC